MWLNLIRKLGKKKKLGNARSFKRRRRRFLLLRWGLGGGGGGGWVEKLGGGLGGGGRRGTKRGRKRGWINEGKRGKGGDPGSTNPRLPRNSPRVKRQNKRKPKRSQTNTP